MAEQFQNFFVTKLREACDAVATTIYVETVPAITEGTLVLEYANSTKHEIIHFTGVSGYGLTGCTRGLEGTTAQSHSAGTDVRQNLTAGMIDKIINGVITTENIANSAVTTAKINNGAVTADKIDFTTLNKVPVPDYANGVDFSTTTYTAPSDGFVNIRCDNTNGGQSGEVKLYVYITRNGVEYLVYSGGNYFDDASYSHLYGNSGMLPVKAGDIVRPVLSGKSVTYNSRKFYPAIW